MIIQVLDVSFDAAGSKFVSASADGTARVYDSQTGVCAHTLIGHEGEISKVSFNPQGTRVITASSDKTCRYCRDFVHIIDLISSIFLLWGQSHFNFTLDRLWDTEGGECLQTFEGHTDEIFSCAFNYDGDFVITGSKDNTCRIWKSLTASSNPRPAYDME